MTLQEKYTEALEKLTSALEVKVYTQTNTLHLMTQELEALRKSNEHYARVVAALESEKVDCRACINDLKAELKEARIEHER
jgi:FtsZ-binding cell division protein ZapB